MAKQRLIHLTSSLKMGGAEAVLYALIKELGHEYDQTVIYFHDGPFVDRIRALNIPVIPIRGFFCSYDPLFLIRLFWVIRQLRPTVLHTLLWSANVLGSVMGKILGIHTVSVWHNHVSQNGLIRNLLDVLPLRLTNRVVVVSEQVKTSLHEAHHWLPATRIKVVHNGIEQLMQKSTIARTSLGLSNALFIFGSVGRFEPVKNYPLLITAFAQISDARAHLLLVGVGSQEAALRALVKERRLEQRVTFVVNQPAQEYYALFDCFVMSSSQEGISIALLEAMGNGLPCVVTAQTNEHPVIRDKLDGLLVKADDGGALANSMRMMMDDQMLRNRIGIAAQQRVQKAFSLDQMVAGYRTLFQSSN